MGPDFVERLRSAGWCQVKEASAITGLRPRQIYRLIASFRLPTQRLGGSGQHAPGRRGPGILFLQLAPLFNVLGRELTDLVLQRDAPFPSAPEPPLSFTQWLRLQLPREDSVGRFAAQWAEMEQRPRHNTWAAIMHRICEHWHAEEAERMAKPAWLEYTQYRSLKHKEQATHELGTK